MKTVKAYYFARPDETLGYEDNRKIILGETHTVEGTPKCCSWGLHSSERVLDALQYAPSSILYVVELGGDFDYQEDKLCATQRTYLERYDIEDILREFARKQALINIEKIKPYCSEEAYNLILEFLETGNEDLRGAASDAASDAAGDAAWSAVSDAAWSSAWSASDAASDPAWHSSWSAARSAAWSSAWSASDAASDPASDPAWHSSWSAARSAANTMLAEMIFNKGVDK